MKKVFEYILSKFPDHRAKIIDLYNSDDDFRSLCEDYLISGEALEEGRKKSVQDKQFEREYLEVFLELEKEIIHVLETRRQ